MTITAVELEQMMWGSRAAAVDAVSHPRRIVTVIAVPYDTDTFVREDDGREFTERFARGAFDGIEKRTSGIYANRDHNRERPVGKTDRLYPHRREGLVADIKISRTPLGDETLALAEDGVLASSLHFGVKPGDDEWSDRGRRRTVNRAFVGHIAFVTEPAYEDAQVVSVRHRQAAGNSSATPLLDELLAQWADDDLRSRFNLIGD